jgi:hypothetical protein
MSGFAGAKGAASQFPSYGSFIVDVTWGTGNTPDTFYGYGTPSSGSYGSLVPVFSTQMNTGGSNLYYTPSASPTSPNIFQIETLNSQEFAAFTYDLRLQFNTIGGADGVSQGVFTTLTIVDDSGVTRSFTSASASYSSGVWTWGSGSNRVFQGGGGATRRLKITR